MHRQHAAMFSIAALMSLVLLATAAMSQTKPNTTSTPKKSPSVAARTVPPVKCTDPDTMVACKSFKQLVEARDQRIEKIILGTPSKYHMHLAYVCLAHSSDSFTTVDFDLPNRNSYSPYSFWSSEDVMKRSEELSAFLGPSTPNHPVDPSIQDQWFNEHLNQEVYDFGTVDFHKYRNGLHVDWESDYGKWSMRDEPQSKPASTSEATFEGAYLWLAGHTGDDKDSPDIGDDPEHAHVSIADGKVYMRYRFENNNGGNTDYGLSIQESTGRFTETFTPSDMEAFENSGTCMIFRQ